MDLNHYCPFCGHCETTMRKRVAKATKDPTYWEVCAGCGASGPKAATQEGARVAWRRRLRPQVPRGITAKLDFARAGAGQ